MAYVYYYTRYVIIFVFFSDKQNQWWYIKKTIKTMMINYIYSRQNFPDCTECNFFVTKHAAGQMSRYTADIHNILKIYYY